MTRLKTAARETITLVNMDTVLDFRLFFNNHLYILFRSCFDTLEGHEATVWAISFDSSGDKLGVS